MQKHIASILETEKGEMLKKAKASNNVLQNLVAIINAVNILQLDPASTITYFEIILRTATIIKSNEGAKLQPTRTKRNLGPHPGGADNNVKALPPSNRFNNSQCVVQINGEKDKLGYPTSSSVRVVGNLDIAFLKSGLQSATASLLNNDRDSFTQWWDELGSSEQNLTRQLMNQLSKEEKAAVTAFLEGRIHDPVEPDSNVANNM